MLLLLKRKNYQTISFVKKQKNLSRAIKKAKHLMICLSEAFAVVREGARRVLGLYPYPCSIYGGDFTS